MFGIKEVMIPDYHHCVHVDCRQVNYQTYVNK